MSQPSSERLDVVDRRALGISLLTGVIVASVVIGLAAQNTLGNLIAGVSLLLYRQFQLGDVAQVTAPTGLETGTVERLTLGYTTLRRRITAGSWSPIAPWPVRSRST